MVYKKITNSFFKCVVGAGTVGVIFHILKGTFNNIEQPGEHTSGLVMIWPLLGNIPI